MDVVSALVAKWGEPDRYARFDSGDHLVEVLKYEARKTKEGVVIYATATSGPSASGHLNEFILGLDKAHDEVADPLAQLCVFARSTPFHHGDSVPFEGTLWRGTEARRFLGMRTVIPIAGPFEIDGQHIEYMNAIPIYESELPIKADLGADEFLQEMRRQGIGFWESRRRAVTRDI